MALFYYGSLFFYHCRATSILPGLLSSGEYSDLTIHCRGTVLKVHCNIVCTQCPMLASAVREAKDKTKAFHSRHQHIPLPTRPPPPRALELDFSVEEPLFLCAMIEYFYKGDYNDAVQPDNRPLHYRHSTGPSLTIHEDGTTTPSSSLRMHPLRPLSGTSPKRAPSQASRLTFNIRLLVTGHKYQMPDLCRKAVAKYDHVLRRDDWNLADFCKSMTILWGSGIECMNLQKAMVRVFIEEVEDMIDVYQLWEMVPQEEGFWDMVEDVRVKVGKVEEGRHGPAGPEGLGIQTGKKERMGRCKAGANRVIERLPQWISRRSSRHEPNVRISGLADRLRKRTSVHN